MPRVGEVHADLMRAAGLERDLEQRSLTELLDHAIPRHGALPGRDLARELLPIARMPPIQSLDRCDPRFRHELHDGRWRRHINDDVARGHRGRSRPLRSSPVDRHRAFVDVLLEKRTRSIAESLAKKAIEALTLVRLRDDELNRQVLSLY